MEKRANWGFCGTQNHLLIGGKNLCVHGEDAKRLLAYSHNTPRDIKVRISQLIIKRIKKIFRFFLSTLDGMDEAKKPSHATVPLRPSCTSIFPLATGVGCSEEAEAGLPGKEDEDRIILKAIMDSNLPPC